MDVESVVTDNKIGSTGDANLITLVNDKMSLDGALDLTNEDATITHTASTSTPTLTISSTNGPVSVVSTAQYVDVSRCGSPGTRLVLMATCYFGADNCCKRWQRCNRWDVTMIDDATSHTYRHHSLRYRAPTAS